AALSRERRPGLRGRPARARARARRDAAPPSLARQRARAGQRLRLRGARGRVLLEQWPESPLLPGNAAARGLHAETRALEERRLRETLERTRGNKSRAARALGLSRQGLLKKLRRYGLTAAERSAIALDGPE